MITIVLAMLAPQAAQEPPTPPAVYRAVLDSPGGELPFGLELHVDDGDHDAVIVNGPERIEFESVTWKGDEVTIALEPYDSKIEAKRDADGVLNGTWTKRSGGGRWTVMGFKATPGEAPRFARGSSSEASVAGRWAVDFEHDDQPAVGIFEQDSDGLVQGTFLTTLGDYRYLAGVVDGRRLWLSCFDGAHAFLFTALLRDDGSLHGEFWSSASWHEEWAADRSEDAQLPDAFGLTKADAKVTLDDVRVRDLDGELHDLGAKRYAGKARLISVFGTWCPNCNDSSKYLAELDRRYRSQGLVVVGVAFEHTGERERDVEQIRQYVGKHGVEYPVVLGDAASSKAEASKAFPLIDRVRAYPTTLFVDETGVVRAVHTGFSGPATGPAHRRMRERFEARIEDMLR